MQAGENTLNLLCARVLLRSLNATGNYDPADFLREYIDFMTEPDRHNDTYAESYHRDFFANYAKGIPPENCAGAEGHDTASIGGLVSLPILIIASLSEGNLTTTTAQALNHQRLTHRSPSLEIYSIELSALVFHIFHDTNPNIEELACAAASRLGFPAAKVVTSVRSKQSSDCDVIGGLLSSACYIDQSFPSVLYLASRYSNNFEAALIANTNVGGDNCHCRRLHRPYNYYARRRHRLFLPTTATLRTRRIIVIRSCRCIERLHDEKPRGETTCYQECRG